jgi:hypothetical protein
MIKHSELRLAQQPSTLTFESCTPAWPAKPADGEEPCPRRPQNALEDILYNHKQALLTTLGFSYCLAVVEAIGLVYGASSLSPRTGVLSIVCHVAGSLTLLAFLLDGWTASSMTGICVIFSLPPALAEVYSTGFYSLIDWTTRPVRSRRKVYRHPCQAFMDLLGMATGGRRRADDGDANDDGEADEDAAGEEDSLLGGDRDRSNAGAAGGRSNLEDLQSRVRQRGSRDPAGEASTENPPRSSAEATDRPPRAKKKKKTTTKKPGRSGSQGGVEMTARGGQG